MSNKNKKRKKRESPKRLIPGSKRGKGKRAKIAKAAGMETEFDVGAAKAATGQKIPQSLKSLIELKKQTIEEGPTYSNPDLKNDWNYRGGEYYQFPQGLDQ